MYSENLGAIAAGMVVEGLLQVDIDTDHDGLADADNPVDLYSFTPDESGTYAIVLAALSASLDVLLHVRDAAGVILLSNDDSDERLIQGNDSNAALLLAAEAGSSYQIQVSSFDYIEGDGTVGIGPYRLGVGLSDGRWPDGFHYDNSNTAPEVSPLSLAAVAEDSPPIILTPEQLLAGAEDVEWDPLSVQGLSLADPAAGQLSAQTDGSYLLSLAPDFNGELILQYVVSDGTASVNASASLSVTPVNDAPQVSPVTLDALVDGSLSLTLSNAELVSSAFDPDGDSLKADNLRLDNAEAGTLTANPDGSYTLHLNSGFNGELSLSYEISDGQTAVPNSASLMVDTTNISATLSTQVTFWKDPGLTLPKVLYQFTDQDNQGIEFGTTGQPIETELAPGLYRLSAQQAASDTLDYGGAISAADASMIARLAVGLISPQNEYQKIAADFDGNGTISAADASMVARQAVGLIDQIRWELTPSFSEQDLADLIAQPDYSPTEAHHRAAVEVSLAGGSSHSQAFVAVLLGDVDGSVASLLEPLTA